MEAIKQIADVAKHGIYIVDLTPGPEILARTVCAELPSVKYYSHHHNSENYHRAKQLQQIQPIGRNHCRVPLPSHLTDHVELEEGKANKKTMVLIIDPPWVDKPIAKGLFSGNASATQIMGVLSEFLTKVRLRTTNTHPPDIKILFHLPKELKTKLPGLKVVEAPTYSHVFYTNFLEMKTIKITVSATKRDAQPRVITRYLDRIVNELPKKDDTRSGPMGRTNAASQPQLLSTPVPTSAQPEITNDPLSEPPKKDDSRSGPKGRTNAEKTVPISAHLDSANNPALPPLTEQDMKELRGEPPKSRPRDPKHDSGGGNKNGKHQPPSKQRTPPADDKLKRRSAGRSPAPNRHNTDDKLKRRSVDCQSTASGGSRPRQKPRDQTPDNKRHQRSASLPPTPEERRATRTASAATMAAFNARLDPVFKKMGQQ